MKTGKKLPFIMVLVLFYSVFSFAQDRPKLELTIIETKINMTQAEKMGKVKVTCKPGDMIRYAVLAQNVGKGMMTEPVISDPIPTGTSYKPHSAKGSFADIVFSIDGGKVYQSWPPKYEIKDRDGKTVKKMASPDMITHIQWELKKSLAPNASKELEFQVIVK